MSIVRTVKGLIPRPMKAVLRRLYYDSIDGIETLRGARDELAPPRRMRVVGPGNFKEVGEEFFRYFVDLGGLQSDEKVLDVGCGIGRMAIPLTRYLRNEYLGFDIAEPGIVWCQRNITRRFPNFKFAHTNVYNDKYNPHGTVPAKGYVFPCENGYFDFVFLTSVFTHMLREDLENYLSEIVRVLRPGGRCLITYFLLNPEAIELRDAGRSGIDFDSAMDGYRVVNKDAPSDAVAYEERYVRELYSKLSLRIVEPIHLGSWCGRSSFLSYQDIVLAVKV